MPRRTQIFNLAPWTGGLNSSLDSGAIPANDLVKAENIIFNTTGSRLKRSSRVYFDTSEIPAVIKRSSSGTTRTLQFAASVKITSPANHKLVEGEAITISSTGTGNDPAYAGDVVIVSITTTTLTNDTITYTGVGSLTESLTVTSTLSIVRNHKIIGHIDYWRTDASNVKSRMLFAVTSQGLFFKYADDGKREQIVDGGTPYVTPPTRVNFSVLNNKLIIGVDGSSNIPKFYRPEDSTDVEDLGGSPPNFSISQVHYQRLFTNDKTRPDRLHYSSTANPESWQGDGDSAALDISVGDGDSGGITVITPSFKGSLFVTKRSHLYEVQGNSPENFIPVPITLGLGSNSPNSCIAVDLDDVVFASDKGLHSLSATNAYGNFTGAFISNKIQPTYRGLIQTRIKDIQGVYNPDLNSIAFSVSESDSAAFDTIYLFNTLNKEWYSWPNIEHSSIAVRKIGDQSTKITLGTTDGRIIITEQGDFTDFEDTPIIYRVKTGTIYVDANPQSVKAFKKISFLYRPKGNFQFTVKVKIDNYSTQALSFMSNSAGDLLGTSFLLGSSILSSSGILAPFTQQIDGYGRGITVEIEQTGSEQQVEIYGMMIEWEMADVAQETIQ